MYSFIGDNAEKYEFLKLNYTAVIKVKIILR